VDETVHGMVLAAGRSTRMGRDKASLHYEGESALRRCDALFASLGLPCSLSLRRDQRALAAGRQ